MVKNILIVLGLFFLLEFYVYKAVGVLLKSPQFRIIYISVTALIYIVELYFIFSIGINKYDAHKMSYVISIALIFLLPKVFIAFFLLIDDVFRLLDYGIQHLNRNEEKHYPHRRNFLSLLGLGLAGLFSGIVVDGIIFGKYRHRARLVKLKIKNLPKAFKGYTIVQISDVHSGSFSHPEKLRNAINLINEQQADLVLFTGDMVNMVAEEFEPFVPLFSEIKAKDAKLAVLGNHDYGYYYYTTDKEQKANVAKLIELEEKAGFQMLRNEHTVIEKAGERLYIIGVENWGLPPFPQYGDLDKATEGIPQNAAKILMSHDPTHFDEVVKTHPSDIALTLSGHTHGMQFGLDLKNIKWSPVQYKYPKWIDLYESLGKYLYVNRGFGVLGFPGRVGVNPEITVFTLK